MFVYFDAFILIIIFLKCLPGATSGVRLRADLSESIFRSTLQRFELKPIGPPRTVPCSSESHQGR